MKDFAESIGEPYAGQQKSHQEIRDTTHGKPEKPANYAYGQKLPEWDSTLPAGSTLSRDAFIRRIEPMHDRILVQLLRTARQPGSIVLTDPQPLIGGAVRKAVVLKTGPGRWIPGEWWYSTGDAQSLIGWRWSPGYRQPVSVQPGQTVLIGNWTDLEVEDIALCQEGDVRTIWGT